MKLKHKILAVLATIVLVWIASPIPEGTIILGLLSGVTGYTIFPDWRFSVLTSVIGCAVGTILSWRLHLFTKIKTWAQEMKQRE